MSALAGLCALRHLDLDFDRAVQVRARNAKASGSDLLDCAVVFRPVAGNVFTALAGVGLAADAVHGLGHCLMRFLRDGAVGHRACFEPLYNALDRLDLFDRNRRLLRHELCQAAQRVRTLFIVNERRVLAEHFVISGADRPLQCDDRLRIVHMVFLVPSASELVEADRIKRCVDAKSQRIKRVVMAERDAFFDFPDADAADTADRAGKVLVNDVPGKADRLKNARRLIGLDRADAHLRRDFHDAGQQCLVVVFNCRVIILVQDSSVNQLGDALVRKVRVDCPRAEAKERRYLMHIPRFRGFENQRYRGSLSGIDQMLLDRGNGQQGRNRHMVFIYAAVRKDDDVFPVGSRAVNRDIELFQCPLQRCVLVKQKRHRLHMEARLIERFDLHQIDFGQNRIIDFEYGAVAALFLQQIAVGADVNGRVGDNLLAQRVNRRVCNLREQLLEIVEQQLMLP